MFWASWVWGPAAGPKGASSPSPKMAPAGGPAYRVSLDTPKTEPTVRYSSRAQVIRREKGMGRMMSLILSSSLFGHVGAAISRPYGARRPGAPTAFNRPCGSAPPTAF